MSIVTHLRRENARLREALVEAQREAEMLAAQQSKALENSGSKDIDFGHLLALVRDFSSDCEVDDGAFDGVSGGGDCQTFRISSPRGDADVRSCSIDEPEVSELQQQLAAAHAEIEELQWALAEKQDLVKSSPAWDGLEAVSIDGEEEEV